MFEYSRHFGIDFILITQDIWKLSPGLMGLPEIHIKVQRRSLSIFKNSFTYMYMSEKDILRKKDFKERSLSLLRLIVLNGYLLRM